MNPDITVNTDVETPTSFDSGGLIVNFIYQTNSTIVCDRTSSSTQCHESTGQHLLGEDNETSIFPRSGRNGHHWCANTSITGQPHVTIIGKQQSHQIVIGRQKCS